MKSGIACLLIFLLAAGCAHRSRPAPHSKWDAMLQMEIAKEHRDPIRFSGMCSEPVTDQLKEEMEKSGIVVQSRVDNMFTAVGHAEQIKKLTRLEFVRRLEAAKPVNMH